MPVVGDHERRPGIPEFPLQKVRFPAATEEEHLDASIIEFIIIRIIEASRSLRAVRPFPGLTGRFDLAVAASLADRTKGSSVGLSTIG
ncbi:hypothetical protein FP2506_01205 [Fulvimarina pelagi HTCC2506]|uniref:Uncharacterized protein n=1 Tax=Fulvimarina pelagi HTCC2506 TaxID=314231 RepID=Q0G256_9HYPH|nr:hypothetical protein FP2506_01205 [Fulvimarina pelagi HTCC2506]